MVVQVVGTGEGFMVLQMPTSTEASAATIALPVRCIATCFIALPVN